MKLVCRKPTDAEVAAHRMIMNSTYGSSGIEPLFKQAYERTIRKKLKMSKRNKEWHPTCGARVGDSTILGVIVELKPETTWSGGEQKNTGETLVKFDRESDRRGISSNSFVLKNDLLNWSRLGRVIEQLIEQRKQKSTQPVFKSMLKNLALLWECKIEEAYKRSADIVELESALEKANIKAKTISRQTTDIKFGL